MQTVIGTFDDQTSAQRAVDRLAQSGIDREDIHLQRAQGQGRQIGQQQGQPTGPGHQMVDGMQDDLRNVSNTWDDERASKHTDGSSFFARLFGMDDQADNRQQSQYAEHVSTYDEAVRRGGTVVIVDAKDEAEADRACELLQECGAYDVNERLKQWQSEGWQPPPAMGAQQNLSAGTAQRDGLAAEQEGTLDVVEEQLRVGKRSVDRGGVRVIQRVSEKPVRELLRLREEHAVVERRAVDRPATAEDLSNFKEGTIEVREMVEEPVVSKTARVVEEVRVGKEVREREETIEDTVRRKDVEVERVAGSANRTEERERAVAAENKSLTGKKDKPRR